MWQCQNCGEKLEDAFDACWKCGTSEDGVENAEFQAEVDVARTAAPGRTSRHWNGFWAGAAVTALITITLTIIRVLSTISHDPSIRVGMSLVYVGISAILVAPVGGLAGWTGAKTDRRVSAACKGAMIMLLAVGFLLLLSGSFSRTPQPPVLRTLAFLVYISTLGAIAATVGRVVGRPRPGDDATEHPVQSIGEMLFLTLLSSLLIASLAVLSR